jgi:hypothetical protein
MSYNNYKFFLYCIFVLIQFSDRQRYKKNANSHYQRVKKGVALALQKCIVFLFLFATAKDIFFNKIMHNFATETGNNSTQSHSK